MADTTKKINNATKGNKVTVRLPRLPGQNAIQEEFYSVNGKNYLIKRGETVEIPEEVAEVIRNNEMAEDYAMNYMESIKQGTPEEKTALNLN